MNNPTNNEALREALKERLKGKELDHRYPTWLQKELELEKKHSEIFIPELKRFTDVCRTRCERSESGASAH